jgi:fatty acid desaturase
MTQTSTLPAALERATVAPAQPAARARAIADDKAMLRAAADLTRDLKVPDPRIYWADLIGSVVLGYGALAAAMLASAPLVIAIAGLVAVLALYRAGSFIHEVSHIKHSQLPGFRLGWNLLVGVPLLIPSFLYEGVHNMHHAKTRYGTAEDPEYLPLALMKPWTLPVFLVAAALAPIALLFRFAVLTPLSMLNRSLRAVVVARYSGLQINPHFRRRPAEGEFRRQWAWQETACSLWAIVLIGLVATGTLPGREALILLAVTSGTMFLNQVRTLVAHLWENDGEPMSVTAQYLDSVNVPPPATLPALWAPVGLRFHALHHLLPGVPYHNLREAHRRIGAELGGDSIFHHTNHRALTPLVGRLAASTLRQRRG